MIYLSEIVAGRQSTRPVATPKFEKKFDVIVCGLGTAGSLAALFSAQNSLSVLGIESFSCVGGTHTAGGVLGHYFGCHGGRYEAMEERVHRFAERYTATTAESRKFLLEKELKERGAHLLYESSVCGVYLEDRSVIGLRVITNDGVKEYGSKIVLDCTADAFVAAAAGCETEYGRKEDRQMQPYSLVYLAYDGNKYRYTNVDFGRVNQLDSKALSRAILFSRAYPIEEGHVGKELIAQMPLIGIREGRRIVAEETVRLDDLFADKKTNTPMFYSYADLDKHGWDIAFDGETMGDWAIGANLGAYNVTVAVPYRAILPKGLEGILVPCRALGVDRDISSCVRMNLDMKKVAEVAAAWASLAVKENKTLRQVPYARLKELLTKSGCLKESDDRGYRIDGKRNWDGTPLIPENVSWITDPEALEQRLKTEKPGQAIWSAKRMGKKAIPILKKAIRSCDENTAKHAAFALAMLENQDGIPLLRKMVKSRDGLMLKDCRKHNQLRGCMAIYWLGRLGDREITQELIGLICDPKEPDKEVYHQKNVRTTRYTIADFEDVYFQFMSQSVMALVRIGNAHADLRSQIEKGFTNAFSDGSYYRRVTRRPEMSSEGNMVLTIKNVAFSAIKRWNAEKQG